jgi:hypothetical protein
LSWKCAVAHSIICSFSLWCHNSLAHTPTA